MSATSQTDPQRDAAGADAATPADAGADIAGGRPSAVAAIVATPAQLAAAREARGWSVTDLAAKLGMVPRQIEAIERGDWDALPGQAFVRGAIRACGKALQADVEPLVASVGGAVRSPELRPSASLEAPLPRHGALGFDNGGSGSRLTWILLGVLGVIAIAMYFGRGAEWSRVLEGGPTGAGAPGRAVETVPLQPPASPGAAPAQPVEASAPPPGSSAGAPPQPSKADGEASPAGDRAVAGAAPAAAANPAAAASSGADASTIPATAPANSTAAASAPPAASGATGAAGGAGAEAGDALRFRFEAESWVEVRDAAGNRLLYGTQPAGSAREIVGRRPYTLVVGNAAQVRLEHGGRAVDLGAIARNGVARLKID
ncbi:MAG: helix-turn-helix domain-containing protein [Burkholderiaceae bacterium]|nr:helix-turn-helix domain-containing protein [Burkholderiaceae bacterium]